MTGTFTNFMQLMLNYDVTKAQTDNFIIITRYNESLDSPILTFPINYIKIGLHRLLLSSQALFAFCIVLRHVKVKLISHLQIFPKNKTYLVYVLILDS